jgi:DNA polymerase-3 subunit epsilon
MRDVVLDTETTGLSPANGDRVVEIGCIELVNFLPTGRTFQKYLDPEMPMPFEAQKIHGLSDDFLRGKPKFADVADEFLDFIQDAQVIAHNAKFDVGFLNSELALIGRSFLTSKVLDTVQLARRKYPGASASLDALCRKFGIDTAAREKHGALLDAELLAQVYLEIVGGRQPGLTLVANSDTSDTRSPAASAGLLAPARGGRPPRAHQPTETELAAHAAFVETLSEPVWNL